MTRDIRTDQTDIEPYVEDLYEHHIESPPQHRLDDICGLESLVEKARQVLVEPHRSGHTVAAGNSVIIQTTPERGTTRLPTAIAGELCDAGFQFARIDLDSAQNHRQYRNQDEMARCIDAVIEEQPFVLLLESVQVVRVGGTGPIQQRLASLSRSDDEVVIVGIDDSNDRRRQQNPVLDQVVDMTLSVPEPNTDRRQSLLRETLEEVATKSDLKLDDSLQFDRYADQLDGFDTKWVRQVAKRAVALAVGGETRQVTDDHMTTAISQVEDERPDASDTPFGRRQQDTDSRFAVETPDVSFDDIGGLDDTIERIENIVDIQRNYDDVYEQAGFSTSHGILLAGPPGTGKTLLAKAVANELDRTFLSVKGPELKHPLYGMTERYIRQLFETADDDAPSVIFFDEFDAIAGDRGTMSHDATQSLVATLLTELDGIEDREDLLVLAATNRPDAIDNAMLRRGRFDEVVEVPLPDTDAQKEIFEIHTEGVPLADDVTPEWFIETLPDDVTGADISGLCEEAFHVAVTRDSQDSEPLVTRKDVKLAISEVVGAGRIDTESPSFQ